MGRGGYTSLEGRTSIRKDFRRKDFRRKDFRKEGLQKEGLRGKEF
jgi:hypothetical protein